MPSPAPGLLWILGVVLATLIIGSAFRLFALRKQGSASSSQSVQSLLVWWVLFVLFSLALLFGSIGLAILFGLAGVIAAREFHAIYAERSFDSPALAISISCMGIVHYLFLTTTGSLGTEMGLPLLVLVLLSLIEIVLGRTTDYLRATAGYFWAWVLLFYGVSHAVALLEFRPATGPLTAGPAGWCVFLVVLTETSDIAQALIGRSIGKRKIVPQVSPGKSWEGLLGGMLVTILLSVALAPWLTSLTEGTSTLLGIAISVLAGILISLCGFLGDVNMSALKREAGVKDSSHLLPGMGGMIDRLDSLTLSAPAFYYLALAVR